MDALRQFWQRLSGWVHKVCATTYGWQDEPAVRQLEEQQERRYRLWKTQQHYLRAIRDKGKR